ncbi:YgiT-type zinc finger protein [Selenomonas ruminantium]|uniref:YgiT-type zinc finger protein n=1 Tax=Selenomonas ruminantium TaxID=971 RepID=UPI0026EEE5E1|nr:YgiT-type zinc finger protein [Selenomonas ruminantium]
MYIVKNVPSNVCKQCGEVAFDDDVFKRLHKIIQEMKFSTSEMVVSTYKAA